MEKKKILSLEEALEQHEKWRKENESWLAPLDQKIEIEKKQKKKKRNIILFCILLPLFIPGILTIFLESGEEGIFYYIFFSLFYILVAVCFLCYGILLIKNHLIIVLRQGEGMFLTLLMVICAILLVISFEGLLVWTCFKAVITGDFYFFLKW
jgi:hypothetical protein